MVQRCSFVYKAHVAVLERRLVTLTEKAAQELKKIMEAQSIEQGFLRVGVKGGGCSGYSYTCDITDVYNPDIDELFEDSGVKVICDGKSHLYLDGTVIDFKEGLLERGFHFENPNHTHCGCGASFQHELPNHL